MSKYLNDTGLSAVWAKIKDLIPTKTSDLTNDRGFINTEHMGYLTNDYLYVPRDWNLRNGASNYIYAFPFILSTRSSMILKNTTKYRTIGGETNVYSVGPISLDGSSYADTARLQPDKLYICRLDDSTSDIKTVCTIPDLQNAISGKLDAPSTVGTEGQVLTLNSSLQPVWGSVQNEVYIGSDTPSGYNIYINPDGNLIRGEGVEF